MTNVRQTHLKLSTIVLALAMVAATAASVRAATASWDPNKEPDLAGYKLSYGTTSGVHTVVLDVGKVTSYPFNPPAGQRYYIVVQAYNTAGELSEKSAEVIVEIPLSGAPIIITPPAGPPSGGTPPSGGGPIGGSPSGRAPTLTLPASQSSTVNTSVSLKLSASDPDGQALRFTATGLPLGLALDAASGVISGIPRSVGLYRITVNVTDGALSASGIFSWSIVDASTPNAQTANQAPSLVQPFNQKTAVNGTVNLPLAASDPEGNPLKFTATGLPPGLSIDTTSGRISGKASTKGAYKVTVTVSDGDFSSSRSFSWAVETVSARTALRAAALAAAAEGDRDAGQDYVGVNGDYDADGKPDLATFRLSTGEWRIWTSGSSFLTSTVLVWGEAGDVPMPADYNGDRVTDLAVYRPSTGTWHLWLSGTQTPMAVHWGGPEDEPVTMDYDGDGKADLGLIRNGGHEILLSSSNYLKSVQVR